MCSLHMLHSLQRCLLCRTKVAELADLWVIFASRDHLPPTCLLRVVASVWQCLGGRNVEGMLVLHSLSRFYTPPTILFGSAMSPDDPRLLHQL